MASNFLGKTKMSGNKFYASGPGVPEKLGTARFFVSLNAQKLLTRREQEVENGTEMRFIPIENPASSNGNRT